VLLDREGEIQETKENVVNEWCTCKFSPTPGKLMSVGIPNEFKIVGFPIPCAKKSTINTSNSFQLDQAHPITPGAEGSGPFLQIE
jgi:hypothetical protein